MMTNDILAFITARLDEDFNQAASASTWAALNWSCPASGVVDTGHDLLTTDHREIAEHVARHDLFRVIRGVEAKRRILAECTARWEDIELMLGPDTLRQRQWSGLDLAVRLLATEWADHDEYRPDWRVS